MVGVRSLHVLLSIIISQGLECSITIRGSPRTDRTIAIGICVVSTKMTVASIVKSFLFGMFVTVVLIALTIFPFVVISGTKIIRNTEALAIDTLRIIRSTIVVFIKSVHHSHLLGLIPTVV